MIVEELNIKNELVPLFNANINSHTKEYVTKLLSEKCSLNEIKRRQKVIQTLLCQKDFLTGYKYNPIYFSETLNLSQKLKTNVFIQTTFFGFERRNVHPDIVPCLVGNYLFLNHLKKLLLRVSTIDVEELQSYVRPILSFIEQVLTFDFSSKKSKDLKKGIDYISTLDFKPFLSQLFELESFISIAKMTIKNGFSIPKIGAQYQLTNSYHPCIPNAKKYSIHFDKGLNILTGANMGGKSTFLKTISICTYLGNQGFSIPSEAAIIPFFDYFGVHFNTKDDYRLASSHFMHEVLSIKEYLEKNNQGQQVFGVFDELFNTTNAEESYKLLKRLYQDIRLYEQSFLIVSTHLNVDELTNNKNINFYYLNTILKDGKVDFTYQLKEGISRLKLGERLFNESGILELLS
ncbi:AAA family ATPase [Flammeovirga yaeyamensis]|uniref:AAA family ATPase n=1 Tax=Flammeovirga yaeyamensis TaxID=367791 RepID=A0AAX1NCY7_9BACT|nr:AAA family ATPase [Flammeovirga yaeyamensis]MBB3696574.1 DNA mismatch repair protein MutS [Flammeovirga yaeyamensis]NMF33252.1 AAA family ATPase [Flammeovirga yaeyamensis]QWG05469.1 AAA family ATPase [Flammeovirga yaeyamensis]